MSIERFERTTLWKSSLARRENDPFEYERDELRNAFFKFRENVSYLVDRISSTLPDLTQHDVSHLDALWETASLIAGEEYPLNALEGFVLGSAILLHDSALCFEAYDKGIIGVRGTLIWKDTYAASEGNGKTIDQREKEADFNALRYLHAEQSSKLVEAKWSYPDKNEEIYLLENSTLRNHLGQVIGQISASHHWAIEEVSSVFSSQGNSPATFPREWRIDYIKIACLLRCADAAHIDNERAPDFLYALIKREGISF